MRIAIPSKESPILFESLEQAPGVRHSSGNHNGVKRSFALGRRLRSHLQHFELRHLLQLLQLTRRELEDDETRDGQLSLRLLRVEGARGLSSAESSSTSSNASYALLHASSDVALSKITRRRLTNTAMVDTSRRLPIGTR